MVTSGSMSGEEKRSDGLLGESGNERRRSFLAPPDLHATALLLDSTHRLQESPRSVRWRFQTPVVIRRVLLEPKMGPSPMIVSAVDREDASQMRLVEHDHVIQAFATD